MKYILSVLAAIVALGTVALSSTPADAGWRYKRGWGVWAPGVGVYVRPRYGYGYRRPYWRRNYYSHGYGPRWHRRYWR